MFLIFADKLLCMSASKGSMTLRRYAVLDPLPDNLHSIFDKGIRAHSFLPIDPNSDLLVSSGWVDFDDPENADLHVDTTGEQIRLTLRSESVKPPAALVKKRVAACIAELQEPPSKKQKREIRDWVIKDLKKVLPPKTRLFEMVWMLDKSTVYFFTQGKGANEEFENIFTKSFGLRLEVADAARWAVAILGEAGCKDITPTPEFWQGFKGVRPLTAVTEDGEE